jgi:hypothetical protein
MFREEAHEICSVFKDRKKDSLLQDLVIVSRVKTSIERVDCSGSRRWE